MSQHRGVETAAPAVGEVVVTARRREERLKDVPVAVTALSAVQLERQGLTKTTDLFGAVPSLYFSQGNFSPTSDFTYLVIRGVGAAPALDPSVGVFIDGVYQPQVGFDLDFLDVDRVEVLRGPQSTLFGRNTEAGALNIVTKNPTQEFYGSARIGGDSFGGVGATAMVSGPLTDNLFANLGVSANHTNGYIHNVTLDDNQLQSDTYTLRSKTRWLPKQGLEIIFEGDFTSVEARELGFGVPAYSHSYDVFNNRQSVNDRRIGGGSLTVNDDLGFANLTLQTAYRTANGRAYFDADGTASNTVVSNPAFPDFPGLVNAFDSRHTYQDDLSQEIRLTSNGSGKFKWLVGAFVFQEKDNLGRQGEYPSGMAAPNGPPTLFDGSSPAANGVFIQQTKTGYSIFGQGSYSITNKLELTAGLRYSDEFAKARSAVNFLVPIGETPTGLDDYVFALNLDGRRQFVHLLPSGSLTYKWDRALTTYVTFAEGEKSGGFQKFPANANDAKGFGAETSKSLEAGIKFSQGPFSLNTAGYHIWLTNQQVSTTVLVDTGNGQTTPVGGVANAASSTVDGAEVEAALQLPAGWSLQGSASYNSTAFTNYVDAQGLQRSGSAFQHFPYVPEWIGSATVENLYPINDLYRVRSQLTGRYFGSYYVGDGGVFTPFESIKSYYIVGLRMALESKAWILTGYINNLLDRYAVTQRLAASADPSSRFDTPIPPRQFGAELSYKF